MTADECPRVGTTLDGLSGLKPVFQVDGTVTAGNACPLNDGAAALVIMSDVRAKELGITPLARVVATGVSALSPEIMGLGPIESTRQALANAKMSIDDIDLFEINEAFAAQAIPSLPGTGHRHRQAQRARRQHRGGPPLRDDRRPDHLHPAQRAPRTRRHLRTGNHVRRRRPRHGHHLRTTQLSHYTRRSR